MDEPMQVTTEAVIERLKQKIANLVLDITIMEEQIAQLQTQNNVPKESE